MRSNRLQLNTSKTELLWCATTRRQSQLPCTPLRVEPHLVNPASTVCDLGIYIDAYLSGCTKVLKTTASCFAALRQLQTVRRCLLLAAYKSLIVSLVLSRLDYGNATLSSLPDYQFRRVQSVINVVARSIFNLRWSDYVMLALMELHWLSAVNQVVDFKVTMLVFRCLHDLAPLFLSSSLHRVADMDFRRLLRSSADTDILLLPRSWLVTVGDRSFLVTIPRTWNNLPVCVSMLSVGQNRLCCHLNDS